MVEWPLPVSRSKKWLLYRHVSGLCTPLIAAIAGGFPEKEGLAKLENMIKSFGTIIGLLLILFASSVKPLACPLELPTATISIKGYTLTAELATTPAARACGMSHRDELPQNHGMLFIYPDLRPISFWMKDTKIFLSIAFLDDSGQIFSIQDMTPMQTDRTYNSSRPASYALEVNQGWFSKHGIYVGDVVEMILPVVLEIQ
jgi:uncharacterized membrane protein (UPF0127 family)